MSEALLIVSVMKVTFHNEARDATAWDDAGFADRYWAAVADEALSLAGSVDASDLDSWLLPDDAVAPDQVGEGAATADPFAGVERVERAARAARAAIAAQDLLFHQILVEAASDPVPWVGPDPTVDPLWQDPRGRSTWTVREHRRSWAVRAAAADIGARVRLTDNQVRARAHRAKVLSEQTPLVWAACLAGDVSEQNMMTVADLAGSLPADSAVWARFDAAIAGAATTDVPGRFRTRARAARERVHAESLAERHTRAAADRRVEVTPELDGMAYVGALLPAEKAHMIDGDLEQRARHLHGLLGETRTLAQIRADVFADLLLAENAETTENTDSDPADGDPADVDPGIGDSANAKRGKTQRARATVRITIPALTLLGHSDQPATLDGYGPIPLETAKELAAGASSWIRVLTHPVTGTIVDVDRRTYRVPADLRRLLHTLHPTCVFPGCSRPADDCDYDHRKRWADGGGTSLTNGEPLERRHHVVKDETLWHSDLDIETGRISWTSPSGFRIEEDPPPF